MLAYERTREANRAIRDPGPDPDDTWRDVCRDVELLRDAMQDEPDTTLEEILLTAEREAGGGRNFLRWLSRHAPRSLTRAIERKYEEALER